MAPPSQELEPPANPERFTSSFLVDLKRSLEACSAGIEHGCEMAVAEAAVVSTFLVVGTMLVGGVTLGLLIARLLPRSAAGQAIRRLDARL